MHMYVYLAVLQAQLYHSLSPYLFLQHEHMVVLLPVSESKVLQDSLEF